jgi:hypothetical protein
MVYFAELSCAGFEIELSLYSRLYSLDHCQEAGCIFIDHLIVSFD